MSEKDIIKNDKKKFKDPVLYMYQVAKARAKNRGIEFNIELKDIKIPKYCPILSIPLFYSPGKVTENTPSLDRMNNSKGYIKGNIHVISWKANNYKSDMSFTDVENLYFYMKKKREEDDLSDIDWIDNTDLLLKGI